MVISIPVCVVMLYKAIFRKYEKGWFALPALMCALLVSLSVMPAKPFENIPEPVPVEEKEETVIPMVVDANREMVYITPSGGKYHKADCSSIKGEKIPIFIEEALAEGKEACKKCYK